MDTKVAYDTQESNPPELYLCSRRKRIFNSSFTLRLTQGERIDIYFLLLSVRPEPVEGRTTMRQEREFMPISLYYYLFFYIAILQSGCYKLLILFL